MSDDMSVGKSMGSITKGYSQKEVKIFTDSFIRQICNNKTKDEQIESINCALEIITNSLKVLTILQTTTTGEKS